MQRGSLGPGPTVWIGTGWYYCFFGVYKKHAIPRLPEELNDIDMVFLIIHLAISIMECWSMKYSKYKIDYEVDGQ